MPTWEPPPDYTGVEQIGTGSQSRVFRAVRRSDRTVVALKALPAGSVAARREVVALLLLAGHPHVLALHGVTEHRGRCWIETDLCPNGTLADPVAPKMPTEQRFRIVARLLAGAADALAAVHAGGLVHRDVKPSNLLLDAAGRVRLADFGIAVPTGEATEVSAAGSRRFAAPELDDGPATPASDLYALGVTLNDLLRPIAGEALPQQRRDPGSAPVPWWGTGLGGRLAATARNLQDDDPARRSSAAAVARRFAAPAGQVPDPPTPVSLPVPPARR